MKNTRQTPAVFRSEAKSCRSGVTGRQGMPVIIDYDFVMFIASLAIFAGIPLTDRSALTRAAQSPLACQAQ